MTKKIKFLIEVEYVLDKWDPKQKDKDWIPDYALDLRERCDMVIEFPCSEVMDAGRELGHTGATYDYLDVSYCRDLGYPSKIKVRRVKTPAPRRKPTPGVAKRKAKN